MGEEAVQVKMQAEEAKVEETKVEQPSPPPPPPSPFVLFVDLHCTGCAKKIEKSVMKIRGVEGVGIDMAKNEVTIKGVVEPHAICAKISKKTKRVAKVLSPLPSAEGEPIPQLVNSQVDGLTVVELNVNMHCEACAQQLKKKILKMRGVQTASTELSTGKVVVTGTMDGNELVDYVYRRTKKQARIVPQPQPQPEPTPPQDQNNPPPPPPPEEAPKLVEEVKKEEAPAPETKAEEAAGPDTKKELLEEPKAATTTTGTGDGEQQGEVKPCVDQAAAAAEGGGEGENQNQNQIMDNNKMMMPTMIGSGVEDHENMKRMMYQYYQYQPLYFIERIPPPQLFSDENPNACCIS